MATNVLMPQLGESIVEGTIVKWNKVVGERVDRDEPLFEVSTDKVDAEIPAPVGGVVTEVRARVGETVPVDSVVAIIGTSMDDREAPVVGIASESSQRTLASASVSPLPFKERKGSLSPLVRKLAREYGIDPDTVVGSGAGGRVTKDDILRQVKSSVSGSVEIPEGASVQPLSPMRRSIADHMVMSRKTSAHAYTVFDVDFTTVERLRKNYRAAYASDGVKLTYLSFIAKAVVDSLTEVPIVNASLSGSGMEVIYKPKINLGIAVALDDEEGLIVPVVKNASNKSMLKLSHAIVDLATRGKAKRLVPDEVQQGTFTITNPGAFGSIFGIPIINQPQVAILCVGAVERRPVVADGTGAIEARLQSYMTLGFDHRLIDGAGADRFMVKLKANLEQFDSDLL